MVKAAKFLETRNHTLKLSDQKNLEATSRCKMSSPKSVYDELSIINSSHVKLPYSAFLVHLHNCFRLYNKLQKVYEQAGESFSHASVLMKLLVTYYGAMAITDSRVCP